MPDKIEISFTGPIPGESIVVALLQYARTCRETMNQENRDRWDRFMLDSLERWDDSWVVWGVLKPRKSAG